MMKIQAKKLAMGVALTASVASFSASGCMLHIPTIPGGLNTAHPASVPVSVATRRAVDAKSIKDIPRVSKQAKFEALQTIGKHFHEMTKVAEHPAPPAPLVFLVYLTESNHWSHFSYVNNRWAVDDRRPAEGQHDVVIVLSDTALMSLLDKSLQLPEAQSLGVLVLSGDADAKRQVIQIFDRFLAAYAA